jgi:hypothetical protein
MYETLQIHTLAPTPLLVSSRLTQFLANFKNKSHSLEPDDKLNSKLESISHRDIVTFAYICII